MIWDCEELGRVCLDVEMVRKCVLLDNEHDGKVAREPSTMVVLGWIGLRVGVMSSYIVLR